MLLRVERPTTPPAVRSLPLEKLHRAELRLLACVDGELLPENPAEASRTNSTRRTIRETRVLTFPKWIAIEDS